MTFDVKAGMAGAIDELEPMPDAIPQVLAQGRRSLLRRRFVAVAGGLTVAAALVVATLTTPWSAEREVPVLAPPAVPTNPQELRDLSAELLTQLMPTGVGPVRVGPDGGKGGAYTVASGGSTFNITFTVRENPDGKAGAACIPTNLAKCQAGQTSAGRDYIVYQDLAEKRDGVMPTAASIMADHQMIELYFWTKDKQPAPLSYEQLSALLHEPRIDQLITPWFAHPDWLNK
jgi:hypothetical protein